jgi:hypothetical protein
MALETTRQLADKLPGIKWRHENPVRRKQLIRHFSSPLNAEFVGLMVTSSHHGKETQKLSNNVSTTISKVICMKALQAH